MATPSLQARSTATSSAPCLPSSPTPTPRRTSASRFRSSIQTAAWQSRDSPSGGFSIDFGAVLWLRSRAPSSRRPSAHAFVTRAPASGEAHSYTCSSRVAASDVAAIDLADRGSRRPRYNDRMGRVASYMVQRNFPPDLARRVKVYFRRLFAAKTALDDSSVLDGLSASLRVEVIIERDRRRGAVDRTIGPIDWAISIGRSFGR